MSKNDFVKTAIAFNATHEHDVVKVASILRRLKNLWKGIVNSDYRSAVDAVRAEAASTKQLAFELSKSLNNLSSSIDDGDLDDYNKAMANTKELLDSFLTELRRLDSDAGQVWRYTVAEMQSPGFLDKVSERLRDIGYDPELGKEYSDRPLRSFKWYEGSNSELYIGDGARQFLIRKTLSALPKDVDNAKQYFSGQNLNEFLNRFTNAVSEGQLLKAMPLTPRSGEDAKPGEREIYVRTSVFEIPELGAKVQADVVIIDKSLSQVTTARKSLKQTKSVKLISMPHKVESSSENYIRKIAAEVERQVVKFTGPQLANVLLFGYKNAFGEEPTLETLGSGWAKVVHELGTGINIPNNNFGNITGTGGNYYRIDTKEYTPEGEIFKHNKTPFRAWSSPEEGATAYWKFLDNAGNGRFKPALQWMRAGDPESAAVSLGLAGYYTAPIDLYAKSVGAHYKTFLSEIAPLFEGKLKHSDNVLSGKLPIKKLRTEYSDDEKKMAMEPKLKKKEDQELSELDPNDQVDSLILKLVATPLTNLVKKSFAPHSNVLVYVTSPSAQDEAKIEYARETASILSRYLDVKTSIYKYDNDVEIHCFGLGEQETLTNAIKAVCDLTSSVMKKSCDIKIYPVAIAGSIPRGSEIDFEKLLQNRRKFNLKRIS